MKDPSSLLDHLQIAVAMIGDEGTIQYCNRAFTAAFAGGAQEWIKSAARVVGGESGWLQGFFVGDETHTIDVDFGGRTYRVDKILSEPDHTAVALAFHDVTTEREKEQAKSDFTSMIVHDLRGPLSGIQGTLEFVLSDRSKIDPTHDDLLTGAYHESERMMGLINELLDFSKIQSGNFVVEREPVRLPGMLKRAVRSLQPVAARSDVHLFSAHGRDLPSITGSEEKLTQALINLISNSLKFTPAGGVISVNAKLLRGPEQVEAVAVTVTDTGVGIKPEDLAAIFEKYKQAGSKALRGGSGTGLGLYIVRQIVEAHGGALEVASIPGVGTSMVMKLPVRRSA